MTAEPVVLQRLVTPLRPDHRPLYLDDVAQVVDRRRVRLDAGARTELATWFNAFPAAWWATTTLSSVSLQVESTGRGRLQVLGSDAGGTARILQDQPLDAGRVRVELPLAPFRDGGWLWPAVTAGDEPVEVAVQWLAPGPRPLRGAARVTLVIPTFDRRQDCLAQLRTLAADPDVMRLVDRVVVVDQGTQALLDHPDAGDVVRRLGSGLTVVRQGNLGGSGGYARGLREAQRRGVSEYALLMDDDALAEPEGILRAVAFADACAVPTLVGGHMFDSAHPTRLYRLAEVLDRRRFTWASAPGTGMFHDLATSSLASTGWLHRRPPTDFAAWFMCLIPLRLLDRIGLPLPLFIKWDDVELGLRAGASGAPTVVLPGAAVWHESWATKGAETGWQAYFLLRNRLVTAMLYSRRGGLLPLEWLAVQLRHVARGEDQAVRLRELAVRDALAGPGWMHVDVDGARDAVLRRAGPPAHFGPGRRVASVVRAVGLTARIVLGWRAARRGYRAAAPAAVSPSTWDATLATADGRRVGTG